MSIFLISLACFLFAELNSNASPIESQDFRESLQDNYSKLGPFIEKLKEQHYSSSETEKPSETTPKNYQQRQFLIEHSNIQNIRKDPNEVNENEMSLKQLKDMVSNISEQLPELEKYVVKVQQYQILVEEQVGSKYPNIGTLPDNLQELIEGPFTEAAEKCLKFITDLKIFETLSNIQLNPFIVFGNDLDLLLDKLVELYGTLKINTFSILENSQRIGPEVILTVDHKCVFCEQRVSMMNMINQVGVFSQVVNDLSIMYSDELKKSENGSGQLGQRTVDI